MSKANEGKQKPAPGKTKIDVSKAMVLMGFKTSRTLEVASFDERRQILDAQLFTRMQEVQKNEEVERRRREREIIEARAAEEERKLREAEAVAAGRSLKDIKKDQKPEKKGSLKKKKKDEEQVDNSLKGVDVRQLHEAYQTLMKKYCPDSKKKSGESEDVGPKDDCTVGMIAF